jgi:butyryl-CoA dehydrogenase
MPTVETSHQPGASPFLTEEHLQVRSMVRDFAVSEVAPLAAELDEEKRFPHETIPKLAELGLLGVPWPDEVGGAGLDYRAYAIVIEELSRVCGTTGITVAAHTSLGTGPIYHFGTAEQRRRWVPKLASGQMLAAFALTEPGAGSDAKATRVTAIPHGDHYLVNGTKIYCTNGTHAGVVVFTARTGGEIGDTSQISAFVVEQGTPGFAYGKLEDKLGLRGSDTRELVFTDCRIPLANRLGEPGRGFKQFMATLEGGRISIGAMALGLAQGALDVALPYAKERRQFGKRLIDMQAVGHRLADMAVEIQAARNLVYEAAWRKDHGMEFAPQASMAKLFASEVGMRAAHSAVQILGGIGYTREAPAERILRDVKLCEIGEGTSEIQRLILTRWLDAGGQNGHGGQ